MPPTLRSAGVSLALFLLLCASWETAAAEVVEKRTVSYFDIRGNTADELDAALNARGPTVMGASSHHPAATRIRFGGQATYLESEGLCRIGSVKVTVETQIILPRWRDRKHAQARLSEVWNMLAADIERHEAHHAEIARDHARQMEKAILALPPQPSCDQLQIKVDRESQLAIERHDAAQARFDAEEAANFQDRIERLAGNRLRPQTTKK